MDYDEMVDTLVANNFGRKSFKMNDEGRPTFIGRNVTLYHEYDTSKSFYLSTSNRSTFKTLQKLFEYNLDVTISLV